MIKAIVKENSKKKISKFVYHKNMHTPWEMYYDNFIIKYMY